MPVADEWQLYEDFSSGSGDDHIYDDEDTFVDDYDYEYTGSGSGRGIYDDYDYYGNSTCELMKNEVREGEW